MKHEKYMLWGSLCVLFVVVGYAIFSKTPVATSKKDTPTTTPLDIYGAGRIPSATSTFNTKNWSATYVNNDLKFSLTFPDSWSGYRPKETEKGVDFGVEDQDTVFSINVYTKKEWDEEGKNVKGASSPTVLKQNNTHVYTVVRAQNFSEKVMPLISVYPSILTTFTLR